LACCPAGRANWSSSESIALQGNVYAILQDMRLCQPFLAWRWGTLDARYSCRTNLKFAYVSLEKAGDRSF
jgi:hypothetical protein